MEKIKIVVPTSWNEVSVGKYTELEKKKLEFQSHKKNMIFMIDMISVLCDMDFEDVEVMDINDFNEVISTLTILINSPIIPSEKTQIVIDDEVYHLKSDFENSETLSETILKENILQTKNNYLDVLGDLLCFFLRKKDDNGEFEKMRVTFIDSRKEMFLKNVSIADVNDLFVFFSNGGVKSLSHSPKSSKKTKGKKLQQTDTQTPKQK